VDGERLLNELDAMLELATSGELFELPEFRSVPEALRRLNDIAFSGDGEPTTFTNFDEIVASVADRKERLGLSDVKLVLITNASIFHRPAVQRALKILDRHNGEIWAKLETGTEKAYQRIARTKIPFQRVLQNITNAAKERPLILQSLFMKIDGSPPPGGGNRCLLPATPRNRSGGRAGPCRPGLHSCSATGRTVRRRAQRRSTPPNCAQDRRDDWSVRSRVWELMSRVAAERLLQFF